MYVHTETPILKLKKNVNKIKLIFLAVTHHFVELFWALDDSAHMFKARVDSSFLSCT